MTTRKAEITLKPSMSEKSFIDTPTVVEITALKDNFRTNREILGTMTNITFEDGRCFGILKIIANLPTNHAEEFDIIPYGSGLIDSDGKVVDYKLHGLNFARKR